MKKLMILILILCSTNAYALDFAFIGSATNQTYYITVQVTGGGGTNSPDGYYWNGSAWVATNATPNAASEYGGTFKTGKYHLTIPDANLDPGARYEALCFDSNTSGANLVGATSYCYRCSNSELEHFGVSKAGN